MTNVNGNVAANTVTVVVDRTPTTVVVAPPLVNLTPGSQQPFSATLDDQFGAPLRPRASLGQSPPAAAR